MKGLSENRCLYEVMQYDIQFEFPDTFTPLQQWVGNFSVHSLSLPSTRSKISADNKCLYWLTALGVKNLASILRGSRRGWQLFDERGSEENIRERGSWRESLKNYGSLGLLKPCASMLKSFFHHLLSLISFALVIGLMFPISFSYSSFCQVFPILFSTVVKKSVRLHGLFSEFNSKAIWPTFQVWKTTNFYFYFYHQISLCIQAWGYSERWYS